MPDSSRGSLETQKYWLHLNLLGQAVCSAECQRPASAWAEEMWKNQVLIFWSVCSSYLLHSLITDSDLGLCRLGWEIFRQQLLEILRVISTRGRGQACSSMQVHQLSIDRHRLFCLPALRYRSRCFGVLVGFGTWESSLLFCIQAQQSYTLCCGSEDEKKARKIHKALHLWSPFSTKGIIFKWTWHPAPLGPLRFYSQPCNRCALSSIPPLSCTELQVIVPPPLHCYSSAIHLWRSAVWRRAWEEKSQSEGRDEMRCDGLARGGKEGMMQIKYARPIRKRQMRWPCCYGNPLSAVEYWVWLCWCKSYKVLNQVWSQTTWQARWEWRLFFLPLRPLNIIILFLSSSCVIIMG